jgi:aminocarboxymuconate-semialdehyde decarboxylase
MASDTIVDIYCHIMPEKFSAEMSRIAPRLGNIAARLRGVKKLFDLDERFREMDCRTPRSKTWRPAMSA